MDTTMGKYLCALAAVFLLVGCAGSTPGDRLGGHGSGRTQFTISLASYMQENQAVQAEILQNHAREILGADDVWIESIYQGLSVNYGHFATFREAEQRLPDIKEVYESLQPGAYQFFRVKDIPLPDPPAPASWHLLNSSCEYSLAIGIYSNVSNKGYFKRKSDAVKAVEVLRDDGIEAFFIHDYFESRIFVGCVSQVTSLEEIKQLRQKYPFYFTNGQKVSDIQYDRRGRRIPLPRQSYLVRLQDVKNELSQ